MTRARDAHARRRPQGTAEPPDHRHHRLRAGRPAAGSPLLRTRADPTGTRVLGTVNNCSGGVTPWGTFLSGEENINQYFASAGRPALARYGFAAGASERGWEKVEPRFDLAGTERGEPVRVHRRGRPVRPGVAPGQAHGAGPVQARGRERPAAPRRSRRGVHGRRRALRLRLQVRVGQGHAPRAEPRAASTTPRCSRPARSTSPGSPATARPPRSTAAGRSRRTARSTEPGSGSRSQPASARSCRG